MTLFTNSKCNFEFMNFSLHEHLIWNPRKQIIDNTVIANGSLFLYLLNTKVIITRESLGENADGKSEKS